MVSVPTFCCVKKYTGNAGKERFFHDFKFVRIARYGKKIQMNEGLCPAYSIVVWACRRTSLFSVTATGRWVLLCRRTACFTPKETTCPFTFSNFSQGQVAKVGMTDGIGQVLQEESDALRAYYEQAEFLIARPAAVELPVVWPYPLRGGTTLLSRIIITMMSVLVRVAGK